ncbi:hypothetical protein Cgig2_016142 [Carnegiea gigantea]|uniref:Uncharacterized protein n=1 Tax=Carnegiea gigantea TaxID=171969 RepID=A0A9Q1QLL8_9CARY|nr:hypothetical protein Cgig2_016142 [Carnegiea gigantea]
MEVMSAISSNTDAFCYTSAPTSPRKCNFNGFYFLSMPTSPTRQLSRDLSGSKSGSRTPETTQNSPLVPGYFEFEASKRFCVYDNRYEKSHDFSIACADELFCDGKVLPLRPPPRAQYTRSSKLHGISSTASSPGARGSMLRVPFARPRSLWNDGFDPFMAALSKVKEENDDVVHTIEEKAQLRRSKSLSPFRWPIGSTRWTTYKNKTLGLSPQRDELGPMPPDTFGPREVVGRSETPPPSTLPLLLNYHLDDKMSVDRSKAPKILNHYTKTSEIFLHILAKYHTDSRVSYI